MMLQIKDVVPGDLEQVLNLNESEVPRLGQIGMEQLRWFAEHADYFRIARLGKRLCGFLIALRPGSSYASPNYRWFCEHYQNFAYIDRIAVASFARRRGVGTQLYDELAGNLPDTIGALACEVNLLPPNPKSMQFHSMLGFRQVGTLESEHGAKQVALLVKEL